MSIKIDFSNILFFVEVGDTKMPKSRLTFSNLRDFITRLRGGEAGVAKTRDSLDNIKNNLYNLKVFENSDSSTTESSTTTFETTKPEILPLTLSRRPPYMYTYNTTLPTTSKFDFETESLFTTTTTSTTTATTTTTFAMPSYFGHLLTSTVANLEKMSEKTFNEAEPTQVLHHHYHHINQDTSTDVNSWYLQHMSSILTPKNGPLIATTASTTTTTFSSVPSIYDYEGIDYEEKTQFQAFTCPAYCTCSCPDVKIGENNDAKKVDLGITLLPCARTAAYQLDLAIKLCRKKALF